MNVRELRIGNLIIDYECKPHYFEVEEVKKNTQGNLSVYYRNGSCMDTSPEPIPLTEEWLLRFGCSHPLKGCFYTVSKTPFIMYDSFKKIIRVERDWLPKKVEFVHQLQNIVDDLSDNKLELKD